MALITLFFPQQNNCTSVAFGSNNWRIAWVALFCVFLHSNERCSDTISYKCHAVTFSPSAFLIVPVVVIVLIIVLPRTLCVCVGVNLFLSDLIELLLWSNISVYIFVRAANQSAMVMFWRVPAVNSVSSHTNLRHMQHSLSYLFVLVFLCLRHLLLLVCCFFRLLHTVCMCCVWVVFGYGFMCFSQTLRLILVLRFGSVHSWFVDQSQRLVIS